jgi:hypothetical protein
MKRKLKFSFLWLGAAWEMKWEWNESKDNFLSLFEWNVCSGALSGD